MSGYWGCAHKTLPDTVFDCVVMVMSTTLLHERNLISCNGIGIISWRIAAAAVLNTDGLYFYRKTMMASVPALSIHSFIFQHRIYIIYLLTVLSLSWCSRGLCSHSPVWWSPPHSRTSPGRVCRGAAPVPAPGRMAPVCCLFAQRLPGPAGSPRAPRSSRWGWDFWCTHRHT